MSRRSAAPSAWPGCATARSPARCRATWRQRRSRSGARPPRRLHRRLRRRAASTAIKSVRTVPAHPPARAAPSGWPRCRTGPTCKNIWPHPPDRPMPMHRAFKQARASRPRHRLPQPASAAATHLPSARISRFRDALGHRNADNPRLVRDPRSPPVRFCEADRSRRASAGDLPRAGGIYASASAERRSAIGPESALLRWTLRASIRNRSISPPTDVLPVPYFHVFGEIAAIAFCNRGVVFDVPRRGRDNRPIRHGGMYRRRSPYRPEALHPHPHGGAQCRLRCRHGEWKTGSGTFLGPRQNFRRFLEDWPAPIGRGRLEFHGTVAHLATSPAPCSTPPSPPPAAGTGWSTPSGPSTGPSRCSGRSPSRKPDRRNGEKVSFRHGPGNRASDSPAIAVDEWRFLLHVLPDASHGVTGILSDASGESRGWLHGCPEVGTRGAVCGASRRQLRVAGSTSAPERRPPRVGTNGRRRHNASAVHERPILRNPRNSRLDLFLSGHGSPPPSASFSLRDCTHSWTPSFLLARWAPQRKTGSADTAGPVLHPGTGSWG